METKRLGKYEIVGKIGQGAMGEVYRAHDPILGRDVAIKTMAAGVGADDDLRKRFHREAQSAARLNHPNIITVHDFGEQEGQVYMAMELLEGSDLKELISRRTPMTLEAKLSLMEQICDGLAFAHAHDVIHRDLKPANIHILAKGQVKIMDFGLARVSTSDMTRAGAIMGTPNYMSPEQVRGEKATARSDVFSLGAVFYELLGGRKPFDADSLAAILYQVMQLEPEPLERARPDLPLSLCVAVSRALCKKAEERFADGGEMREALREVRATMATTPPEISTAATLAIAPSVPAGVPRSEHALSRTSRPTVTRVPVAPAGIGSVSREAAAAEPVPGPNAMDETVAVRQPTLSGKASTHVPARPQTVPPLARRGSAAGESAVSGARTVIQGGPARERVATRAVAATGLVLTLLVGFGIYLILGRGSEPTASPAAASQAPAFSLDEARRALEAKDFRAAVAQSEEVLKADPGSAGAREVLDEARTALRAIEGAVLEIRTNLDAGDTEGASRALARLQAFDPAGPETKTLATRLGDVVKGRAQEARASMERVRREAEQRRGVPKADVESASAVAREADAALRKGEFALAARQFAQARDGFERALRAEQVVPPPVSKPTAPPPAPAPAPTTLAPPTTAPAPTPATTLPPPPTLPPTPAQSEASSRQAIRGVLDEYRQAFESRNAEALKAVQPGVDYEAIKKVFSEVTAYAVKIQVQNVAVGANTATASCVVTYSPTPKPAGKIKPVTTVFHLKKTGDLWLIEKLERK
jgi:serine/threonine protein kinase/tetratricopeptide (TPR) repeat protein